MRNALPIIIACTALTACGFQPMYGSASQTSQRGAAATSNIRATLQNVEIKNIPDREGQYLRNALIDRFYVDGRPAAPDYLLDVSAITERIQDLDITRNSDATRAQLRLETKMVLTDARTNKAILSRDLQTISSYNVLTSEFATRVSEQSTRENALNDLARQIELHIALFLQR